MNQRLRWIIERLPLIVFMGMYVFSCYIGVLLLLTSSKFWAWTNLLSAPQLGSLDRRTLAVLLVLLHGGPVLLWIGYEAGLLLWRRCFRGYLAFEAVESRDIFRPVVALYGCTIAVAVISLARGDAFGNLKAWTDYFTYVKVRFHLFSVLSHFEFVNIYTWLPLASSLVLILRRRWWYAVGVFGILGFLELSLFQKRPLLTGIVLICAALCAYWYLGRTARKPVQFRLWLPSAAALCAALYLVNAALMLRLVLSPSTQALALEKQKDELELAAVEIPAGSGPGAGTGGASVTRRETRVPSLAPGTQLPRLVSFDSHVVPPRTGQAMALYVFFAPLTRTSVPAIAYAEAFPDRIPYYHLDLALDILGIGRMPDDNRVVSRLLWPDQRGASAVAVPFHFALYSQGGIWIALFGALLVGATIGCVWSALSAASRLSISGSLAASLVLVLAWMISTDSVRNALLASYGVLWGAAPVILVWTLEHVRNKNLGLPFPRDVVSEGETISKT
jgi:hypothetical protein